MFRSAKDACDHYVRWSGGVKALDYGKTCVQGGHYVTESHSTRALAILSRILRRVERRQPTRLMWLCYRVWRLQADMATPTVRELARAHNRRAPKGDRISHTTMGNRLKAIDEQLVAELIREDLWSPARTGDER